MGSWMRVKESVTDSTRIIINHEINPIFVDSNLFNNSRTSSLFNIYIYIWITVFVLRRYTRIVLQLIDTITSASSIHNN